MREYGTKTIPVFLSADGEASWSVTTSTFGLLTIRQQSATRKNGILLPLVFDSLYFVFCLIFHNILIFQILGRILNFTFTKISGKSDYLRWLHVKKEK